MKVGWFKGSSGSSYYSDTWCVIIIKGKETYIEVQSCMIFTEKIVVAKISAKVLNSFKVIQFIFKMKSSVVALFPLASCIPLTSCPLKSYSTLYLQCGLAVKNHGRFLKLGSFRPEVSLGLFFAPFSKYSRPLPKN